MAIRGNSEPVAIVAHPGEKSRIAPLPEPERHTAGEVMISLGDL